MTTIEITAEQRQQYVEEGYVILERVLTDEQLELLRDVADYAVAKADREMDEKGSTGSGCPHGDAATSAT